MTSKVDAAAVMNKPPSQEELDRVPGLQYEGAQVKQIIRDKLIEHKQYIQMLGEDMPEISNWKWEL